MDLKDSNDLSDKKFRVLIDTSYDIHSQVGFISGGIDLLHRKLGNELDEDLLKILELIRASAYHILSLKDNCRDFFMLTSEQATTYLHKENCDLVEVLNEAIKRFHRRKESTESFSKSQNQFNLALEVNASIPNLFIDKHKIQTIVLKLARLISQAQAQTQLIRLICLTNNSHPFIILTNQLKDTIPALDQMIAISQDQNLCELRWQDHWDVSFAICFQLIKMHAGQLFLITDESNITVAFSIGV